MSVSLANVIHRMHPLHATVVCNSMTRVCQRSVGLESASFSPLYSKDTLSVVQAHDRLPGSSRPCGAAYSGYLIIIQVSIDSVALPRCCFVVVAAEAGTVRVCSCRKPADVRLHMATTSRSPYGYGSSRCIWVELGVIEQAGDFILAGESPALPGGW